MRPGAAGWLLAGLLVLCLAAAFTSGGIGVPEESRLQVGVAVGVLLAGVALAAGALRTPVVPGVWAAAALIALLGVWSAAWIGASALPDATWLAANRAVAYAGVIAIALLVGSSLPDAPRWTALGITAVTVPVVLYALAGKLIPGLGFDHVREFARLRAPIGYANGLGLLVIMGTPGWLWIAADPARRGAVRLTGLAALTVTLVVAGLTLSRGAVLALLAVAVVMIGVGTDRRARAVALALALAAATGPLAFAFASADLTGDFVPLERRTGDGLILLGLLTVALAVVVVVGRVVAGRAEAGGAGAGRAVGWLAGRSAPVRIGAAVVCAVAVAAAVIVVASTGESTSQQEAPEQVVRSAGPEGNQPGRLITARDSNRLDWWDEALGGFADKPAQGWGAGSFTVVHRLYRTEVQGVTEVHSVPLSFLVETGVVGTILALAGLGLLLAAAAIVTVTSPRRDRPARVVLVAIGAAWAVHGLADWDWSIPAVTLPALIALGVASAPGPDYHGSPVAGRSRLRRSVLAGGLAAGAVVLAVSAALPALAEGERRDAQAAAQRAGDDPQGLSDAAARASVAARLNPLAVEPLFTGASIAERRGDRFRQLELLGEAARIQPDNPRVWLRLLELQLERNDFRLVQRSLREVARTDPVLVDTVPGLQVLDAPPYAAPGAAALELGPLLPPGAQTDVGPDADADTGAPADGVAPAP